MASISLIGPLTGYTAAASGSYKPTIQHDPINAVMKVTVDIAKALAAFKASNSGVGITATDKIAICPLSRGMNLLSGKIMANKLGSTATAKTTGQVFTLGDTTTATKFAAAGTIKMQASGGTVSTVLTPAALTGTPVSYDTADDALILGFVAVDAANDLPVDGIFEVVIPFTNMLPELKASLANGSLI
jgi:hypothetical protein